MKFPGTYLSILFLTILFMPNARAGKVQAIFSKSVFFLNGKQPLVETNLLIKGNTVVYQKIRSGKYQGTVQVMIAISKLGKAVYTDKYNLQSPETADSVGRTFNFIDQQRIPLDTGNYDIEISMHDINSKDEPVKALDQVHIIVPQSVFFSDIQLIESYSKAEKPGKLTKSGYDLVPHISDYYAPQENKLTFYSEVYKTLEQIGKDEKYLVSFYLTEKKNNQLMNNFSGFRRMLASDVGVILQEFNIELLPSGAYSLVLEVKNKENALIASHRRDFLRNNPGVALSAESISAIDLTGSFVENFKSKDSLTECIHSLRPIASEMEKTFVNNLLDGGDFQMMKQYFLTFWQNRSPLEPELAWANYSKEVKFVNKDFKTAIRRGYDTDRGRVYLQYGPPDNRTVSLHEPSAYPYEIWHYYRLKKQSNRRFVFYNTDLITNDFVLLHSDALGEIMNDQWQFQLMKRDSQTNDMDAETPNQHFGNQIQQNFQAPR